MLSPPSTLECASMFAVSLAVLAAPSLLGATSGYPRVAVVLAGVGYVSWYIVRILIA